MSREPPGRTNDRSGGKPFVHAVDFALQLLALGRRDTRLLRMDILRQGGEDRAEIEQLVLHAAQNPIQLRQLARRFAREADEAVQLVDRAIGFDAEVVLRKPLAAGEAGLARCRRAACRRD